MYEDNNEEIEYNEEDDFDNEEYHYPSEDEDNEMDTDTMNENSHIEEDALHSSASISHFRDEDENMKRKESSEMMNNNEMNSSQYSMLSGKDESTLLKKGARQMADEMFGSSAPKKIAIPSIVMGSKSAGNTSDAMMIPSSSNVTCSTSPATVMSTGSLMSSSPVLSSSYAATRKGLTGSASLSSSHTGRYFGVPGDDGEYYCMSQDDLRLAQDKIIGEVSNLLSISRDQASVLLLHFKWNQERLTEKYYSDIEGTLKAAGAEQVNDVFIFDITKKGTNVLCRIVYDDVLYEESFSMGCTSKEHPEDHRFSLDAWRSYLSCKVSEGPASILSRCPMDGCNCVVSPSVWRTVFCVRSLLDLQNESDIYDGSDESQSTNIVPSSLGRISPKPLLVALAADNKSSEWTPSSVVAAATNKASYPSLLTSTSSSSSTSSVASTTRVSTAGSTHLHPIDKDAELVLSKYENFLNKSFVEMNSRMKWCPTPNCTYAIMATGAVQEVKCVQCKQKFCFKCYQEAHAPASCKTLKEWLLKCSNESETANWILANTKTCPQCSTRIEKNQGCNHMTCTRCRHEFCWVCSGPWSQHGTNSGGYYNCNKYQAGQKSENEDDATRAKRELDRYLFYYRRYHGHEMSLKFANKQKVEAENKMKEMQERDKQGGWSDVEFLAKAVDQLIECRRVLKYTYVYAFYLQDGPGKSLFEYNQMMLESNTERLSELTERPIDRIDRAEVTNFTRVTGSFVHKLLEQIMSDDTQMIINLPSSSASAASAKA